MKKMFLITILTIFGFFISGCIDLGEKGMHISLIKDAVNPNYSSIPTNVTGTYDSDFIDLLQSFTATSTKAMIEKNTSNIIISPISYYMTLALLAEMTNGLANEQIMTFLNMPSLAYIRTNTKLLFEKSYKLKNESDKMFLGNSIWIDDSFTVKDDLLNDLAQYYYALSYHGDLQSLDTAQKMKAFIDSSTGNLLNSPVESYIGKPLEVIRLYNTLYLESQWINKLSKGFKSDFTLEDGTVLSTDFLCGSDSLNAYIALDYTSYLRYFKNGFKMNFVLPALDQTPYDLIEDSLLFNEIINIQNYHNNDKIEQKEAHVYLPQFSYRYNIDLIKPTKNIGITNIFDDNNTGFIKVNSYEKIYVSGYKQESYIELDEGGIKAAALTTVEISNESVDTAITLNYNRPFLFIIYDIENIPLFIGIINNPSI